jgi:hypothetical protein
VKKKTGFKCSDEISNQIFDACIRSDLSSLFYIITDCPAREKNGWTGDAQLVMETGLWNFKAEKACTHFLEVFADAQRPSGQLPGIAPTGGWGFNWGSGPAWDILLFEYPWQMYLFCGNTENIRRFYGNMQSYIEYCQGMSENDLVRFMFQRPWAEMPQYDFLVVDEVQDYTELQIFLLRNMCKAQDRLIFAGDGNQIINPTLFRESRLQMLFKTPTGGTNLRLVHLIQNFRKLLIRQWVCMTEP